MLQSGHQTQGRRKIYTPNKSSSRYTSFSSSMHVVAHKNRRDESVYHKKFNLRNSFIQNPTSSKNQQYETLKQKYEEATKKFTTRPQYYRTHKTISYQSRLIEKSVDFASNISELSIRKQPLRIHTEQVARPLKIKFNNLLLNQVILPQQNPTNKIFNQNSKFNLTEVEGFESEKLTQQQLRARNLEQRKDQRKGQSRKIRNLWREHKKELLLSVKIKVLAKEEDKLKGWQTKNTHRQQFQQYSILN